MAKTLNHKVLSDTLSITECTDGFWLYDETRGMNLAMKAKTSEEAFLDALDYYQNRLKEVESNYSSLKAKVDHFVGQFPSEDDFYCDRCGTCNG